MTQKFTDRSVCKNYQGCYLLFSEEQKEYKKRELLEKCFELFVKRGLENTSFNELATYCNVHKSTMYNYLKSKDEIVVECAKMYMTELDDMFFKAFLSPEITIIKMLKQGFKLIASKKNQRRFVYQVVSSPFYGERAQKELSGIYMKYLDYSEIFAKIYNIDALKFRPYFLLFVSTMHDYCMWGNEVLVKEKLDFIYNKIDDLQE